MNILTDASLYVPLHEFLLKIYAGMLCANIISLNAYRLLTPQKITMLVYMPTISAWRFLSSTFSPTLDSTWISYCCYMMTIVYSLIVFSCISLIICEVMQVLFFISRLGLSSWELPVHIVCAFLLEFWSCSCWFVPYIFYRLCFCLLNIWITYFPSKIFTCLLTLFYGILHWKKYLILIRLNQPNIAINVCALFISFKKLFSMPMLKNTYFLLIIS